jgi:hypothetical protein
MGGKRMAMKARKKSAQDMMYVVYTRGENEGQILYLKQCNNNETSCGVATR